LGRGNLHARSPTQSRATSPRKNGVIRLDVITDPVEFLKIENSWDGFIKGHTENPFLLSAFLEEFWKSSQENGWAPMIMVFSTAGRIIGVAPLATKKRLGVRFGKFLLAPGYFPDFIIDNLYQDVCVERILDFMFRNLHCQIVSLTFSAESPLLEKLREKRNSEGMTSFLAPAMGHYVVPVDCGWAEFEKSKGKKFRQDIRRTERNLDILGSWTLTGFTQEEKTGILDKILQVESKSWKEEWRTQRRLDYDHVLKILWKGSIRLARLDPDFKWIVWLLESGGLPLAYSLVLKYKRVAYITKTSHDNRYRRLSLGVYTLSMAIRDIFKDGETEKAEFHTDLPFVRTWASTCLPRVNFLISRQGFLPILTKLLLTNEPLKRVSASLLDTIHLQDF
jgi:hypothetical protein